MKRHLFSLIVLFVSFACMAQEHLSFKGIPLEGSMDAFCKQLSAKGFKTIGNDNNTTLFTGDFTGRNATVGVIADDEGENVYSVVVLFDASDEWKVLVNTYNYYKDLYTRKYGKPATVVEKNNATKSVSPSDAAYMLELISGRATWGSLWEVTGGEIEITIEKAGGYSETAVVIRYRDAQNEEAKIQKHLEEI
ncbi:MAG: hypothetical protein IKY64_09855 [Bacteroidaceae bacterium]|nr:hypothetical protein [Bacteroidaceae bacterium]